MADTTVTSGSIVQPRSSGRSETIDFMRGIAMLLVVFGHAQRGVFQTGLAEGLYWTHIYPALDYFMYVFHVPIFFATSGILLERQARNSFRDFQARETRVLALYLLWNFINAVPAFLFSDLINRNFGRSGWIAAFNPFQVNGIMWFFVALFAAYLVHFLTIRIKPLRWAAMAVSMLVLAFDMDVHGVAYGTLWLLAGAQVEQLCRSRGVQLKAGYAIAALTVYLVATTASYWLGIQSTAAFLGCAAALAFIFILGELITVPSFLSFLGRNTLALYVMHVIAIAGTRIFLIKLLGLSASVALVFALTIVGILIPIAVLIALRSARVSRLLLLD